MGNRSRLHIVGVVIKEESRKKVQSSIAAHDRMTNKTLKFFLSSVIADEEGMLSFKAYSNGVDPYEPDERGEVCARDANWSDAEAIAAWIKRYGERGGHIILHSLEGDGRAWGWEFDGKGRSRYLELRPSEKWL